jgi:ectoine hydroxylase-related dioxygenase (phytanoyl-CoA dioxygenase family)
VSDPSPDEDLALRLARDGAERYAGLLSEGDVASLRSLADATVIGRSGSRISCLRSFGEALKSDGAIGRLATALLGDVAHPVRAVVFDKTAEINWSVPWHQDRTVAVRARRDVPGFGPWSTKSGLIHVEPPFDVLSGMITIRAHLDDCGDDNAPLLIVPGSHRLGAISAGHASDVARRFGHVRCRANVGDVWVYATPIVHASERARSPTRRRVIHVDYAKGCLPGGLEWLGFATQ